MRFTVFKAHFKQFRKNGFIESLRRYNVYEDLNLLYVDIPKNASTSVKRLFLDHYNIPYNDLNLRKSVHLENDKRFRKGYEDISRLGYQSFAIVRNPFERLVSTWKNLYAYGDDQIYDYYALGLLSKKHGYDKDFDKFAKRVCMIPDSLSERHFISQSCYVVREGSLIVDHILRFEHLNSDWLSFSESFNLGPLTKSNSSPDYDWRSFYDKKLALKVYKRYKDDFEKFGYQDELKHLLNYLDEESR